MRWWLLLFAVPSLAFAEDEPEEGDAVQKEAPARPSGGRRLGARVGLTGLSQEVLYGRLRVGYEQPLERDGARLRALFDTHAASVEVDELSIGADVVLALAARGEARFANRLDERWVDGEREKGQGFDASYAQTSATLRAFLSDAVELDLGLSGARWFFGRSDDTEKALSVPDDLWMVTPSLSVNVWQLEADLGHEGLSGATPRLKGFAFDLEASADFRSETTRFGAQNQPEPVAVSLRQSARYGTHVAPRTRLELRQDAAISLGEDDLTRDRLGGEPTLSAGAEALPGAPAAAYRSLDYVSGGLKVPVRVVSSVELAPVVSAVVLAKPDAPREAQVEVGAGLALDARLTDWLVEARAGYCPTFESERPALSLALSVGVEL